MHRCATGVVLVNTGAEIHYWNIADLSTRVPDGSGGADESAYLAHNDIRA